MKLSQLVTFAGAVVVPLITTGCDRAARREPTENLFRIIATDTGFEAPDKVPAGLRHISYENRGSQIHEADLVRLAPNMTADSYVAASGGGSIFPAGALDYSGAGLMSPGETVELWTKLDPGNYIVICWNAGHARTTKAHPFTVDYAISDDPLPKEDVTLKLLDYRFDLVGQLRPGLQVIRVENRGPSMHEVDIFRLHDGKTMEDVRRWRKEDEGGPAQADAMGGALDSHDVHRVIWLRKKFTPGRYVLHCGMPDTINPETTPAQKTNHADLGMVQEFEIRE